MYIWCYYINCAPRTYFCVWNAIIRILKLNLLSIGNRRGASAIPILQLEKKKKEKDLIRKMVLKFIKAAYLIVKALAFVP